MKVLDPIDFHYMDKTKKRQQNTLHAQHFPLNSFINNNSFFSMFTRDSHIGEVWLCLKVSIRGNCECI